MYDDLQSILDAKDPLDVFTEWLNFAKAAKNLNEATAMILATASNQGVPSLRTVLLKGYDKEGFIFFTNYQSQKARDLATNPRAELLFYWDPLGRQVRIRGEVTKISPDESDAYWATRPRESQLGAWVSKQSEVVPKTTDITQDLERLKAKYENGSIPRPENWGGYRLKPTEFEFWIGQLYRLHERLRFKPSKEGWAPEVLYP